MILEERDYRNDVDAQADLRDRLMIDVRYANEQLARGCTDRALDGLSRAIELIGHGADIAGLDDGEFSELLQLLDNRN